MLGVTALFVAITALLVWRNVRREQQTHPRTSSGVRACPRCGTMVSLSAAQCPSCHVPLQAFELVAAPVASGESGGDAPLRAHVRADMCVGVGACVAACPEPEAITLRGKLAVVNPERCKGHGECVKACPIGAITLARGAAANRVVVPALDIHFQTNVPGIYIVGELGGRGLIKNAINEGRIAIEHIRATRPRAPSAHLVDVAIVGAGPAGLSAGLEAVRCGLSYVLLEQGSVADSVRKYPRHKLLLAEPVRIPIYGELWIADASKEALLSVWQAAVERAGLQVRTGRRVESIERATDGVGFVVRDSAGESYRARCVVLAMGRRGTPRRLGVPGEDRATVVYDIAEMSDFAGRRVLVVGGGDSAVESAVGLANQANTSVALSYRGEQFERVKQRNRDKLAAAERDRALQVLLQSQVREIRDDVAVLDVAGESRILPTDDVVVRIGGTPPQAMLDKLGVTMVEKELAPQPESIGA